MLTLTLTLLLVLYTPPSPYTPCRQTNSFRPFYLFTFVHSFLFAFLLQPHTHIAHISQTHTLLSESHPVLRSKIKIKEATSIAPEIKCTHLQWAYTSVLRHRKIQTKNVY